MRAAYPAHPPRYRSALGAYAAGVGVNSVVPARGGDVVKLYLLKQRIPGATYATLTPTLIVETLFDFVVSGAILVWVLSIGVLPAHQVYSRIPTVDWRFFLQHERFTALLIAALLIAAVVVFVIARRHYTRFRARVAQGFAIMHDGRKLFLGVIVPQAVLLGLPDRVRLLLFACVSRPRDAAQRAARTGRRVTGDAVPGDTRRCRHEAGADRLRVPRRGGLAEPAAGVQRRA